MYPAEVEDVLATHPGVAEVAVTGTRRQSGARWSPPGSWPPADRPTPDELAEFCPPTLAPYKRPRLVHVVDELPRNALGKVIRSQLGR